MTKAQYMFLLSLVMAGITYCIRVIPFTLFRKKIKSVFIKSVLYYVPYAVLTAMTFPSIFFATGNLLTSFIGTAVAIVASLTKRSMVVVAILAVLSILITDGVLFFISELRIFL